MANYAYVQWIKPDLTKDEFFKQVSLAVRSVLGALWELKWAGFDFDGPTLLVTVPNTSHIVDAYWGMVNEANPKEDVGFTVSLQDSRTIAFRHGPNIGFARWAQGCIEEELSDRLDAPLHYDSVPTTYKPGHREYRRGRTYREYLLRDSKAIDTELLKRLMLGTPPGFDT